MVAGAVVGISLGVLIVILIIWLVFRKKEKKKYEEEETPNEIRFAHLLFLLLFVFTKCYGCVDMWGNEGR